MVIRRTDIFNDIYKKGLFKKLVKNYENLVNSNKKLSALEQKDFFKKLMFTPKTGVYCW